MLYEVECPYCGHKNKYDIDSRSTQTRSDVVFCEAESGGCEKRFVLSFWVEPKSKAFEIVGENEEI